MQVPDANAVEWTDGVEAREAFSASFSTDALTQGFAVIRGIIPRDVIGDVARDVRAACVELGWLDPDEHRYTVRCGAKLSGRGYDDPKWITLQQRVLAMPSVHTLRRHPALLSVMEHLLGAVPTAGHGDICRVVFPDVPAHTTRAHQDRFYLRSGRQLWTAWIPLTACSPREGPLAVVAGSHRLGLRSHEGAGGIDGTRVDDDERWVSATFAVGDVMVFHGETVHAALHNMSSGRLRVSIDMRFSSDEPVARPEPKQNPFAS